MGRAFETGAGELVQGTLEMLILRTLARGENHGFGIAQAMLKFTSEIIRIKLKAHDIARQRRVLHDSRSALPDE